jgi:hypothetical protein
MVRDGHVVMVAVLPQNIGDEEAIAAGRAAFGGGRNQPPRQRKVYDSEEGAAQADK